MSEPLYVDPERLARHARPYQAAAQEWVGVQLWVARIRDQYNGAWGDDDLGNKFGPSFLEGLDSVEGRAEGVATNLTYYGEGLVENGQIFGEARDDADQSSHMLLVDSEYVGGYEAPDGAVYFGVNAVDPLPAQPRLYQGVAISQKAPVDGEQNETPGMRMPAFRSSMPVFVGIRVSEPAEPLLRGEAAEGDGFLPAQSTHWQKAIPAEPLGEGEPGEPMLAAGMRVHAGYAPLLHGRLPAGQEYGRLPADQEYGRLPADQKYGRLPADQKYGRFPAEEPGEYPGLRTPALRSERVLPIEPLVEPGYYAGVEPFEAPVEALEPPPAVTE